MLDHVTYPPEFDPRISPIYALNEADVRAPAAVVWRLLVEAENWSSYFPPEDQVRILGGAAELGLGTRYTRVTIGFPMSLVVTECVPARRLSWSTTVDSDETGSSAFHGWVITPTADGCHVLSEETQQGPWFLEQLGHKHPGGSTDTTRTGSKRSRARPKPSRRKHRDAPDDPGRSAPDRHLTSASVSRLLHSGRSASGQHLNVTRTEVDLHL